MRFWDYYALRKIRDVADYQFGRDVGKSLFPDDVEVRLSRRTGRIRYILLNGLLLATLRPTDGLFSLTVEGATFLLSIVPPPRLRATVLAEISSLIRRGGNVFAKHIIRADPSIVPGEEVMVVDQEDSLLAVGRAVLNGEEMSLFKRGVAVKVRKGVEY